MSQTEGLLTALLAVQGEAPTLPKDATNPQAHDPERRRGWKIAQETYELGNCEYADCTAPAHDRHHIDSDSTNNAPENVARYCRRHHMTVDGRIELLAQRAHAAGAVGGRPIDVAGRQRQEQFLLALLEDGPIAAVDVRAAIDATDGVTWRGVEAAKKRLGVRSQRRVNDWVWVKS